MITVTSVGDSPDVCAVYYRPHWLMRLLFRRDERWFYAVRVPAYNGGFVWLDDKTTAQITDGRVTAALDLHRKGRVIDIDLDLALQERFRSHIARS